MTINEQIQKENRLLEILSKMDVPPLRKELSIGNLAWLGRNLGIRNHNNPLFPEAKELIELLGSRVF